MYRVMNFDVLKTRFLFCVFFMSFSCHKKQKRGFNIRAAIFKG